MRRGEERGRRDGFGLDEDEVGNRLEGGEKMRAGVIRSRGGSKRGGSRVRRLHATSGVTTRAGGRALAELLGGGREGRQVREHQCEAEQDGYDCLHARSV